MNTIFASFIVWTIFGILLGNVLIALATKVSCIDYYLKYLPFIIICGEIVKLFVIPIPEAIILGIIVEGIHLVLRK